MPYLVISPQLQQRIVGQDADRSFRAALRRRRAALRIRRQVESRRLAVQNTAALRGRLAAQNKDERRRLDEEQKEDVDDEKGDDDDEVEQDPITKQFIPEITFCGFILVECLSAVLGDLCTE